MQTYPAEINLDRELLAKCIDDLISCSQACTACADACLSEPQVAHLTKCIRTDLDCADICSTTARILSRHTGYDANISRAQLEACITACRSCANEYQQHADMHDHCRICADACRSPSSSAPRESWPRRCCPTLLPTPLRPAPAGVE